MRVPERCVLWALFFISVALHVASDEFLPLTAAVGGCRGCFSKTFVTLLFFEYLNVRMFWGFPLPQAT